MKLAREHETIADLRHRRRATLFQRNMEGAIKTFSMDNPEAPTFNVSWKPFFLNLKAPESSDKPIKDYLLEKYGEANGSRMIRALADAGKRCGIAFTDERVVHNTLKSHRLVHLAGTQGKQDAVIEKIFSQYFEHGKNIADVSVLSQIASETGVEGGAEYLEGKQDEAEVIREFEEGVRRHRIQGVPHFVIQREGRSQAVTLSGAQPSQAFEEAFEALQDV